MTPIIREKIKTNLMKKTYLEILKKPLNMGDVVKRIDVTGYSKKEINKSWDQLDSEIDKDIHVTRQLTVEREMIVFDNLKK